MTSIAQTPITTNSTMTSERFFELISKSKDELMDSRMAYTKYWQSDGGLKFEGVEFENSIEFNDEFTCIYALTFISCKFKRFHVIKAVFNDEIIFENCEMQTFKVEKEGFFCDHTYFVRNCQIDNFQLNGGTFKGFLSINSSRINSNFLIIMLMFLS